VAVVGLAAASALAVTSMSYAAPRGAGDLSRGQQSALDLGIQVADKTAGAKATSGVNPYLANLPTLQDANYFAWAKKMRVGAKERAASKRLHDNKLRATDSRALSPAFVHDEEEPAGTFGSNDSAADAERISQFGTAAAKNNRVRILGELADVPAGSVEDITTSEDQGSIPLATDTGITGSGSVETTSVLGDGPHGLPPGDETNDFDFYKVEVDAGHSILANTEGSASTLDTLLVVYAEDGTPLAADDDGGTGLLSNLSYTPDAPGTYYVLVAGYSFFGPLPEDPFDSGSGLGGADTGDYALAISVARSDRDFYSVRLRPGDVVGAVGKGSATGLSVTTPSGEERVGGVGTDASFLYPPTSPLPGGGNTTIAYVAEQAGWYAVEVTGAVGDYDVLVEGYRPGTKGDPGRRQTVLLDFDPGRVNSATWGGPGMVDVSPFRAFVPLWGIPASSARQVENRIVNQVRANIQAETQGNTNPTVNVEVLNARGHENLIGRENVSRIYVAGTIDETGLPTIGVAQYIDPGNFGHQDEAIVLLDVLSEAAGPESSLNSYLTADSNRIRFVSQAVANVTAHEIGHTIGNYHTDNANDVHNMMDSGGANFGTNLYGVGPDNVGGTADDENIQFQIDTYSPAEGFTGLENTENVSSWAYAGR